MHHLNCLFWQRVKASRLAERACDSLFVPGGTYIGSFRPFVTMSRNLLPFDPAQRRCYGLSWTRLRLILLEKIQATTFRRAAGVIFLTKIARRAVERRIGALPGQVAIMPHGVAERFRREPRTQEPISTYSLSHPFRWLYVSPIDLYKHQWHVAEAVARVRQEGLPVVIDLVGSVRQSRGLRRLQKVVQRVSPAKDFIRYHGPVPYSQLTNFYHQADGFVFASSCETFGQILLEAMASGLPIACSKRSAMPEILREAGVYFDPESPQSIAEALHGLMVDPDAREQYAWTAYQQAQQYSWSRCAMETFSFLAQVAGGLLS